MGPLGPMELLLLCIIFAVALGIVAGFVAIIYLLIRAVRRRN